MTLKTSRTHTFMIEQKHVTSFITRHFTCRKCGKPLQINDKVISSGIVRTGYVKYRHIDCENPQPKIHKWESKYDKELGQFICKNCNELPKDCKGEIIIEG